MDKIFCQSKKQDRQWRCRNDKPGNGNVLWERRKYYTPFLWIWGQTIASSKAHTTIQNRLSGCLHMAADGIILFSDTLTVPHFLSIPLCLLSLLSSCGYCIAPVSGSHSILSHIQDTVYCTLINIQLKSTQETFSHSLVHCLITHKIPVYCPGHSPQRLTNAWLQVLVYISSKECTRKLHNYPHL